MIVSLHIRDTEAVQLKLKIDFTAYFTYDIGISRKNFYAAGPLKV